MLTSGQRSYALPSARQLELAVLTAGSPIAQVITPVANDWHRSAHWRCRSSSAHLRSPKCTTHFGDLQTPETVRQNLHHRRPASCTKLGVAARPTLRPVAPLLTGVAFSTADIRLALRLVASNARREGVAPSCPTNSSSAAGEVMRPRRDRPADWETNGGDSTMKTSALRRRSRLSPVCSAGIKFKSGDIGRQQSEKNDLLSASREGGATNSEENAVKASDDKIAGRETATLAPTVGGWLRTRRDVIDERVSREKKCEQANNEPCSTSIIATSQHNELGASTRVAPVASHVNSHQSQQVATISKQDTQSTNTNRNPKTKSLRAAPQATQSREAEVMSTGSFVAVSDRSSQQQDNKDQTPSLQLEQLQNNNNNNNNSQQLPTRYNLALQPQTARPIGLGCAESVSFSSSLSSEGQEQDCGQQDLHVTGPDSTEQREGLATNMNQISERYTIISSSSVVSFSEASDDQAQQYGRNRGDASGVGAGGSTGTLNQRGVLAGKNVLGKLVGKKAARIRELLLQNLGRADRTSDELFDECELNFYRQQQHVQQLIKEFKAYTNALKGYHDATRSLSKCIQQSTSNYQLARHDLACDSLSQLDQLNEDLMEKLHEKVIKSLNEYMERFDEIKEKINKRHRKLIDYDGSRRLYELMYARVSKKRSANAQPEQQHQQNYQSIMRGLKFLSQQQQQQPAGSAGLHRRQESAIASQLVDEARLLKLREQFNYCKLMYETINSELHEEMPRMYERKMKSLLEALQNYYDINAHYHSEASKLIAKVGDVMVIMRPQSASDEANTVMYPMYDDPADGKLPASDREIAGAGSGSSGVSLSGSASRSSGSSLASPDCDDRQRDRQAAHGDEDDEYDGSRERKLTQDSSESPVDSVSAGQSYAGQDCLETAGAGAATLSDLESNEANESSRAEASDDFPQEVALSSEMGHKQQVDSLPSAAEESGASASIKTELAVPASEEAPLEHSDVPAPTIKMEDLSKKATDSSLESSSDERKNCLYRVRTNYKYLAEDVDELCFEANEIIRVIEFDENQEPEDGWLLGIREVNNQQGLFPANFTQPI